MYTYMCIYFCTYWFASRAPHRAPVYSSGKFVLRKQVSSKLGRCTSLHDEGSIHKHTTQTYLYATRAHRPSTDVMMMTFSTDDDQHPHTTKTALYRAYVYVCGEHRLPLEYGTQQHTTHVKNSQKPQSNISYTAYMFVLHMSIEESRFIAYDLIIYIYQHSIYGFAGGESCTILI